MPGGGAEEKGYGAAGMTRGLWESKVVRQPFSGVCSVLCKIILPWLPLQMASVKTYYCSRLLRSDGFSFALVTGRIAGT